jgi:nitrogen regulatory protein P-II 1
MKYIIAIIQPYRLEEVKKALSKIEVFRLTVSNVEGVGRQKGYVEIYRGKEYEINLINKVKLEIAVNDEFVEPTINAIINSAKKNGKGEVGDGKIFILPLEDVIRIRTNERGKDAI